MAKLRKKELLEFLDTVEQKASKSVTERYNTLIAKAKEDVFQDYDVTPRISIIQKKINELQDLLVGLATDLKENTSIKYNSHYDLVSGLSDRTGTDSLHKRIIEHCSFNCHEVQDLKKEKETELAAVTANYHKVRVVCQSMRSADKITEYLEGLGFDLSFIKKKADMALTAPIDTTKLFVCGDTK